MKFKRKALHINSSLTANAIITNKVIYGADHIVVEGAGSIIADTVMNGIYYPRDEVEKLAAATNGDIHAPSAHPVNSDGVFISAGSPQAIHQNYIGAISTNYRMSGDRLVRDIAINPEIANQSADGKEIIRRINAGEDTDTSTGLLLQLEEVSGIGNDGEPYEFIARNMELDHDALLLRERGAATTLQGVGMFANHSGDDFSIDEVTINESMIANNLPLAPGDHVWNESDAIARIKSFTNSEDKPSSNYRRFFLNFDRKRVDEFDAYTNAFADIIDGVPHAVKAPLQSATNSDHAKVYLTRFAANKSDNGVFTRLLAWAKNMGYNGEEQQPITNQEDSDIMDRTELIALLAGKDIAVNADISDADLKAKLTEAMNTKADPITAPVVNAETLTAASVAEIVANAIKPLQDQLSANSDKELTAVVAKVVALNKGIDEATAKLMGLSACNSFLAANGKPAFNSNGQEIRQPNTDNGLDNELPE